MVGAAVGVVAEGVVVVEEEAVVGVPGAMIGRASSMWLSCLGLRTIALPAGG